MCYLVGNPEDRFSHDKALIMYASHALPICNFLFLVVSSYVLSSFLELTIPTCMLRNVMPSTGHSGGIYTQQKKQVSTTCVGVGARLE